MSTPHTRLVEVSGTILAASSIEAIGPVQEEEAVSPGWLRCTFWVSTRNCAYQWKGERFEDAAESVAAGTSADKFRRQAEEARQELIRAVWPDGELEPDG